MTLSEMTLSGMTPAEQVAALGLAVGDTIEGRQGNRRVRLQLLGYIRCRPVWEHWFLLDGQWIDLERGGEGEGWPLETVTDWRKISSDPSIDPLEPLRRELREAYGIIGALLRGLLLGRRGPRVSLESEARVKAWLARNAGFGPGKGDSLSPETGTNS